MARACESGGTASVAGNFMVLLGGMATMYGIFISGF
jgi:hypothetical protein